MVLRLAERKDSGYSYYLDNINNIDGAAVFLNLEPRRDLIKDFRSVFIKKSPNL